MRDLSILKRRLIVWPVRILVGLYFLVPVSLFVVFTVDDTIYRRLHAQITPGNIRKVSFEVHDRKHFVIRSTAELRTVAKYIDAMKVTGLYKFRLSECSMIVTLNDGMEIYYDVILDFRHQRAKIVNAGNPSFRSGGISFGFYEEKDSRFFQWLTGSGRFDLPREELRYCMPYSARHERYLGSE